MKTLKILKISIVTILLVAFSCTKNKKDKMQSIFAGGSSMKWYTYSIDSVHCSQAFYPFRVLEFFQDGKQIQYINNRTTKNLDKIPQDNMNNPEKWFIINDSVVSIESELNPVSGYYHKQNRKLLYYSKDTIILQGTKRSNYEGILILTRYKTSNNPDLQAVSSK